MKLILENETLPIAPVGNTVSLLLEIGDWHANWHGHICCFNAAMSRRRLQGGSGAVLLEFALITPIFILFLFGIISFGLLFSWRSMLNNAAREGARGGAVCKTDDEIRQIVRSSAALLPHADTVVTSITVLDNDGFPLPAGTRERGGVISVTVNYQADVLPIPSILSNTRALIGRATFRMECSADAP